MDVEAYIGPEDRACHASRGRTKRTEVMFGPSGVTYVYLIYGMYHCLNFVTERIDFPAAILIRGIEVVENGMRPVEIPVESTGQVECADSWTLIGISTGWTRLRGKIFGSRIGKKKFPLKIIQKLPRIGVDYAGEWAHKPWRFCLPSPSKTCQTKENRSFKKIILLPPRP